MQRSDKSTNGKRLKARVTYLEMTSSLAKMPPVPTKPPIALMRAENILPSFYSYLYEMVGKPHHWEERRTMPAAELVEIANAPETEITVLYVGGCPAGFFELDLSTKPKTIEIKYLGLIPHYHGLGLGKWFIASAINAAWLHKPEKVTIETNTLDHPAALPLYQKLGFSPCGIDEVEILEWL